MDMKESTDSGCDGQFASLQLEDSAVSNTRPSPRDKCVHVPVRDRYFVLYKKTKRGLAGALLSPQGVGPSMWIDVKPRMWDRAFECRAEWKDGCYIIGRARKGEVEVFDERDYQPTLREMPSMPNIRLYNRLDPPSMYPGKSRSQRNTTERLMDAFHESVLVEHGNIEYAIMAEGLPSRFLLIASVGRKKYEPGVFDLDTITINGCIYPVMGYILDGEVNFTAENDRLDKYLIRQDDADFFEWRWIDVNREQQEKDVQETKRDRKRKKRMAKKAKQEKLRDIASSNTGLDTGVNIDEAVRDIRNNTSAKVQRRS